MGRKPSGFHRDLAMEKPEIPSSMMIGENEKSEKPASWNGNIKIQNYS